MTAHRMTIHPMNYIGNNLGSNIYECPECGRTLAIDYDTGSVTVLKVGDANAEHTGGMVGVQGSVSDVPAVFDEFLRGIE